MKGQRAGEISRPDGKTDGICYSVTTLEEKGIAGIRKRKNGKGSGNIERYRIERIFRSSPLSP